jgi:hypothetical protein
MPNYADLYAELKAKHGHFERPAVKILAFDVYNHFS